MKRDMMKTVDTIKGKDLIPTAYDMDSTEMKAIYEMFKSGDPYDAICTAFDYGFVLGARAQKTGKFQVK